MHISSGIMVESFAGFDISEMQYPIFYYSSWRVPYQNEFSLGCIGYIMVNTGLSEAFELVYAGNTLPHLFSGKAIDLAWRAHQLVDISSNTLLLKDSMENNEINVDSLQNMIKDALNGTLDISAIKSNPLLQVVNEELEQKKEMMKETHNSYSLVTIPRLD